MENFKRYTLGQFMALNHGKYLESGPLHERFESYPPPKWGFGSDSRYNNPHNHRFAKIMGNSGFQVKRAHVLSDESILDRIRAILCSITANGSSTILVTTKLNQLTYPHTKAVEIAQLFHETMIECGETMVDEYLKVIFAFKGTNGIENIVRQTVARRLISEFTHPSSFAKARIEKAEIKEQRWRTANSIIIAKMAVMTYNTPLMADDIRQQFTIDNMYQRFLGNIFYGLDKRVEDIHVLSLVIPILSILDDFTVDKRYPELLKRISDISDNASYPPLLRAQLMDLVPDPDVEDPEQQ